MKSIHNKMMNILLKSTFCAFVSLIFIREASAQEHGSYTQKIKGTDLEFNMVAIPAGVFEMGSIHGKDDEKPVRQVKISPFWIGAHEVTWDLFETFLYKDYELTRSSGVVAPEVDAVTRPTKPYLDMTFGMGKEGRPAVGMTHYNAIQFCKWLYVRTGVFYRLPTEAEWEYACRAGTKTAYYFGEDMSFLDDNAWHFGNSDGKVQMVGKKKPNAWGLYDIIGNVAEWTYDQYVTDFYAKDNGKLVEDPVAIPTKLYAHVVRGGSFESDPKDLRSSSRMPSSPAWKNIDPQIPKSNWWFPEAPFIGLRLVRPVTPPSHDAIMAYYNQAPIADF